MYEVNINHLNSKAFCEDSSLNAKYKMKGKKYLFIIEQPLCHRNRKRFGIDFFNDSEKLAGIIDLTQLLHPDTYREFSKRGGSVETSRINYISPISYFELIRFIQRVGGVDYVFDQTSGSFVSTFLRCYLRLKKVQFVGISGAFLPVSKKTIESQSHLANALRKIKRIRRPKKIINRMLKVFNAKFIPDDYFVITGSEAEKVKLNTATKKIFSHTYDYDLFLFERCPLEGISNKKYIVFIDEDEVNHIDFLTLDYLPSVTKKNYFLSLDLFFSFLEKKYNIPVIIAEHPRAYYSPIEKKEFFCGKDVLRGKTLDLINNAELVISHSSTSIGIAVLFEKPIILLATQEMIRDECRFSSIEAFSQELGLEIVDADSHASFENLKACFTINRATYKEYVNKYLKHSKSADGIYSWQIVVQALESN